MVGGAVFSVLVTWSPSRWDGGGSWSVEHSTQALLLLYTTGVLLGAFLALTSWRIARRFGWRGLAAFVIVVSIDGPIRERLYLSAAHVMVARCVDCVHPVVGMCASSCRMRSCA